MASDGVDTDYYQPLYYDGYVVFYDGVGRPYYYVNGVVVWMPSTYAYYGYYTNHWRAHRTHYTRWYSSRGRRYQTYRRSPGYYRHQRGARRGATHRGATRRGTAQPNRGNRGNRGATPRGPAGNRRR